MKNRGNLCHNVVVCMKTLSNASIKPSLLQRHLQTNHQDKKDRDPNYFKRLGENAKKTTRQNGEAISAVGGDNDSLL